MHKTSSIKNVLPRIFCLEDIQCSPDDAGGFNYRATLYHDQACITVAFNCSERDPALEKGAYVSIRWLPTKSSVHGAIQIAGLSMLNCPATKKFNSKAFNPFQIVPRTCSVERHLINCARDLLDISSKEMRQMLFATVLARAKYQGRQSRNAQ